jgi:D-xylose transport system substrate-binding protein
MKYAHNHSLVGSLSPDLQVEKGAFATLLQRTGLAVGIAGLVVVAATTFSRAGDDTAAQNLKGKIYFLTPNSQITRWERFEKPIMEAALKKYAPHLELIVESADDNPSKQLDQAQAAIADGASVILLAPPVPNQAQSVVLAAHSAGIPVINYAYAASNADVDYYVTVPFASLGENAAKYVVKQLGGKKPLKLALITGDPSSFFDREQNRGWHNVLDPMIKDGTVQVVCQSDNLQDSEENALTAVEGCLQQAPDGIDAVLVHNDSSVNGAVAALTAQNVLDKVKVFGGYDGQASAIQYLLAGYLGNDAVPRYNSMATTAIKIAVALLTKSGDEKQLVNGDHDNGMKKVPTFFAENIFITPDNVKSEMIDTGLLTMKDVCAGPAAASDLCRK